MEHDDTSDHTSNPPPPETVLSSLTNKSDDPYNILEQCEIMMRSTNIDVIDEYAEDKAKIVEHCSGWIVFSLHIPGLYVALRRVSDHLENRYQSVVPVFVAS